MLDISMTERVSHCHIYTPLYMTSRIHSNTKMEERGDNICSVQSSGNIIVTVQYAVSLLSIFTFILYVYCLLVYCKKTIVNGLWFRLY